MECSRNGLQNRTCTMPAYSFQQAIPQPPGGCSCRFIALVKLEQKLANNPNKKLLMEAIAKKRLGQFDSFFDHLHTEMIITGDQSALLNCKRAWLILGGAFRA